MESTNVLSDDKSLENFARLLHTLSKKDNFIMFILAKDGLHSSLTTPEKLGLTKKQYYTRLNELLNVGLITNGQTGFDRNSTRNGSLYFHTTLGRIIFQNHIGPMIQEVKNAKSLLMVDILRSTRKFSDSDIETFVSPILEKLNLSLPAATDKLARVRVLLSEAEVGPALAKVIQQCQRDIFVATRSYVRPLIQQILQRAISGVKVRILADVDLESHLGEKLENMIQSDYKDGREPNALKYIHIQENVQTRRTKVPFEILLIDDKFLVIGLIDRRNFEKFNAAIIIEDGNISKALTEYFAELWERSVDNPSINSITYSPERNIH